MKTITHYNAFNQRRYSNPWVAIIKSGKLDFIQKVGTYTGRYNSGEEGDLVVFNPEEGAMYGYGQKDYRGNKSEVNYCQFTDGKFIIIDKIDTLK